MAKIQRPKHIPFPPSFQKRLDRLRRRARNRGKSDTEILRNAIRVLEAIQDPNAFLVVRAKKPRRKK